MIEIILTVCAIANPNNCEEKSLQFAWDPAVGVCPNVALFRSHSPPQLGAAGLALSIFSSGQRPHPRAILRPEWI